MQNLSGYSQQENRIPLDRRLSLKFSSAANTKNNSRMSIPMRRESLVTSSSFNICDQGIPKDYRQSLVSNISNQSRTTKKSAILNNLVRKLGHQQELQEIIQSKIKNTEIQYPSAFRKTDINEPMQNRLRGYQGEVQCFKEIITELVNKINLLENNKDTRHSKDIGTQTDHEATTMAPGDDRVDFIDNLDRTLKVLSGKKMR